jgi:hypothetical protein
MIQVLKSPKHMSDNGGLPRTVRLSCKNFDQSDVRV